MKIPRAVWTIGAALAISGGAWAADFELPLTFRPTVAPGRSAVVSNGVPLLVGQAKDVDELHVIGPDGKEVPAQFRVLARWWRLDNSIRWVLVSFVRGAEEPKEPIYKLVGAAASKSRPATKMKLTEDDEAIRIDTGAATFEVSTKRFNLLSRVTVGGQTVVQADAKSGSVVEDTEGRKYYSALGTDSVRVLDKGPAMVRLVARGRHVSDQEGAFKPYLYGYEIFMTFHAGQPYVNVDAILTNNPAKPIGEPHFKDWSLLVPVGRSAGDWQAGAVKGKAGESTVIYQDSVGTDNWQRNLGIKFFAFDWGEHPSKDLATFRGYKQWRIAGDSRQEVAAGDFSDGVLDGVRGDAGCVVVPRYFWQQFPSAVGFGGDGVLRLSPFPREYKEVHWLEDATAKGQEFHLYFHRGAVKPAEVAARYTKRTFALPSPEHCGQAGALSDLGPYMNHPKIADAVATDFSIENVDKRLFSTDSGRGNGYGWQVFGMRWFEAAGHSPWNYEPLASSDYLWRALLSGRDDHLEWGLRVSRHFRDVRAYQIDDRDNLALWTTFDKYWEDCCVEHFNRLMGGAIESRHKNPDPQKTHPYKRYRWPLPNMSHMNCDEVYDLYLLTGDERALRCMRTCADHGMAWVLLKPGRRSVYRDEGWCTRTVMRYYELTADKKYEPIARGLVEKLWHDIDKAGAISPGHGGTWYQAIYARGVIAAYMATGDERMRDLALGCADWAMTYEKTTQGYPALTKDGPYWEWTPAERLGPKGKPGMPANYANGYHIDLFAWAYDQTGDPKYLPEMEYAWKYNANSWWLGYFPTAMYMAYGPRDDKTAPAAVTDLKAEAGKGEGSVSLAWTAPGDDGAEGTAAVYQIKYAPKPIVEFVTWPGQRQTHINFWGSANVPDEPSPAKAGTRQSYTVKGLAPGTYWFALKARDERNNQSGLSNVVSVTVK